MYNLKRMWWAYHNILKYNFRVLAAFKFVVTFFFISNDSLIQKIFKKNQILNGDIKQVVQGVKPKGYISGLPHSYTYKKTVICASIL